MRRICFWSLFILFISVILNACGGSSRNCAREFAESYNSLFTRIQFYAASSDDLQDFAFRKSESQKACDAFQQKFGSQSCMADKNGRYSEVSGQDFDSFCAAVREGKRIVPYKVFR